MSGFADQGAALPWAATGPLQEEAQVETDVLPRLGLPLGARVEVKWEVHGNDEQSGQEKEPVAKWWGAVLDSRPAGETDGEGRQVYVLRYDPAPDMGFEEEECCRVTFLEDHYLYDIGQDDELPWRREGEAWDEPAEGAEVQVGAGGAAETYTLQDIAAAIELSERRRGRTLDQEAAEALAVFEPDRQRTIAAGFQSFAGHITAALGRIAEQHGPGHVVTEADVRAATAEALQAAMQGAAGLRM